MWREKGRRYRPRSWHTGLFRNEADVSQLSVDVEGALKNLIRGVQDFQIRFKFTLTTFWAVTSTFLLKADLPAQAGSTAEIIRHRHIFRHGVMGSTSHTA